MLYHENCTNESGEQEPLETDNSYTTFYVVSRCPICGTEFKVWDNDNLPDNVEEK